MAQFSYLTVNKNGEEQRGRIEAQSANDAVNKIRQMGLFVLEIMPEQAPESRASFLAAAVKKPGLFTLRRRHIQQQELVIFTRQLSVLLDAGLPLVRCLSTLSRQTRFETIEHLIADLISVIESGKTFSEALSQYPSSFSKVYVNMVRAGETGGALDEVLRRLADYLEKNLRLSQRIRAALIYPALVLFIAFAVLGFVITFVIPRFMELFRDSGVALPLITQILLTISELFRSKWYILLAIIAAAAAVFRLMLRINKFRLVKDALKLKIPVFGPLTQKIAAARFARTLSTLISGGVPILHSLELTKDISGNEVIARSVGAVRASVSEGGGMARVLEHHRIFPQLMVSMIAVGEESGSLDKMLFKVAEAFEEEVDIITTTLTALIEPFLIIFLGGIIGFIVVAMFMPIISLIQALSQ